MRFKRLIAWWFVAVALTLAGVAFAAPTLSDSFENETLGWQVAGGNPPFQVTKLQRSASAAHRGTKGIEVELIVGNAAHVDLAYDIGRAPVIRELAGRVWIRADRPGVQLLARIVLPRTADPDSQQPIEFLIHGDSYESVGRWQSLAVEDFPRLVKRQSRKLRAKLALPIDERGAYVDRLVLRVCSERGTVRLAIDDLTVDGHVEPRQKQTDQKDHASVKLDPLVTPVQHIPSESTTTPDARTPRVQMQGSILLIDGSPWFPRIVEYSGETFDELRRLGFNTVALRELATGEQLAAARKVGLWIVCPPPAPEQLETNVLSHGYDVVLAWWMGEKLSRRNLPTVQHWIGTLRRHDPWPGRPLVGQVVSEQRAFSRLLDVFVVECPRQHLAAPAACLDWLLRGQSLARPGTAHWGVVPTQLPASLREQADFVAKASGQQIRLPELEVGQITRAAFLGLASGNRGLVFTSDVPFITNDTTMNRRAAEVELVNNTIRPLGSIWAEAEQPRGISVQNGRGAFTLRCATRGQILIRCTPCIAKNLPGETLHFTHNASNSIVVPGVPEATSAYRWSTDGLELLSHRRAAGGMRVRLGIPRENDILLFTQDKRLTTYLHGNAASISQRGRQLKQALHNVKAASHRLSYEAAIRRLAQSATKTELLVAGGAFERLLDVRSAGWRHLQSPTEGVVTGVEIASDMTREGDGCLHIFAIAADGRTLDAPPAWIDSPPIPLSVGDLVRVSGYCRIEAASGYQGGLQITDSIGGPTLTLRMATTSGWRRFSFYRIAPRTEMMRVTFAVTGVGDIWLDDVRIERLMVPPPGIATAEKTPIFSPPAPVR